MRQATQQTSKHSLNEVCMLRGQVAGLGVEGGGGSGQRNGKVQACGGTDYWTPPSL